MVAWRLIESGPGPGPRNMAIDQALLDSVKAGGRPALRFYRWRPACLSLGRNQTARGRVRTELAVRRGIQIVRRPTGGTAVYHDAELTYAVVVPVGVLGSPRETYRAINRALVAGLNSLGVAARTAGGAAGGRRAGVCFHAPAPGEVVVDGRKLVGSAQRCERRVVLQHGSVLLSGDQRPVVELLDGRGAASAAPAAVALDALLARPPAPAALARALAAGFEDALGIRFARVTAPAAEEARVHTLTRRFRAAEWTWRR